FRSILTRMINNELLNQLATNYAISVSQDEINKQTENIAKEIGGKEALDQQLKELYGWSLENFQKEILQPLILKNKLKIAITLDDRINQGARIRAEEILVEVKENKDQFAELAKKYSEDVTALQGGDMGYFKVDQILPEFEQATSKLEPGEITDLVKTQFGYHILKVEEKLNDDEGNVSQIRARQILIRTKDLDSYLEEIKQGAKIWKLVRI
ncbi:MAG: peptidylprolyl isomerase, partial [Patescibacteria group bacterium]|nr:peptidylprolyl isomerase [Patescibacteria group bacterium]